MSAYNISDYRAKFVEYKDLDKIHGQTTLKLLGRLLPQLKRHAQTVPTTLGRGQLGYLTLILSIPDYNDIPISTPFVRPVDPGIFTPTPSPVNPRPVLCGQPAPVPPPPLPL